MPAQGTEGQAGKGMAANYLKNLLGLLQEGDEVRYHRQAEQEKQRRLVNQFRDLKEDYMSLQGKEADVSEKRAVLEKVTLEPNNCVHPGLMLRGWK